MHFLSPDIPYVNSLLSALSVSTCAKSFLVNVGGTHYMLVLQGWTNNYAVQLSFPPIFLLGYDPKDFLVFFSLWGREEVDFLVTFWWPCTLQLLSWRAYGVCWTFHTIPILVNDGGVSNNLLRRLLTGFSAFSILLMGISIIINCIWVLAVDHTKILICLNLPVNFPEPLLFIEVEMYI